MPSKLKQLTLYTFSLFRCLKAFEMNNLLGRQASQASNAVISKAEHLKVLLVEWMRRMDGPFRYYSTRSEDKLFSDLDEVLGRRTWPETEYWQSDTTLTFGQPVYTPGGFYERNEYLYLGRTAKGRLTIRDIYIRYVSVWQQE